MTDFFLRSTEDNELTWPIRRCVVVKTFSIADDEALIVRIDPEIPREMISFVLERVTDKSLDLNNVSSNTVAIASRHQDYALSDVFKGFTVNVFLFMLRNDAWLKQTSLLTIDDALLLDWCEVSLDDAFPIS